MPKASYKSYLNSVDFNRVLPPNDDLPENSYDVATLLINAEASINQMNKHRNCTLTHLLWLVKKDTTEKVTSLIKFLIEEGADVDYIK